MEGRIFENAKLLIVEILIGKPHDLNGRVFENVEFLYVGILIEKLRDLDIV